MPFSSPSCQNPKDPDDLAMRHVGFYTFFMLFFALVCLGATNPLADLQGGQESEEGYETQREAEPEEESQAPSTSPETTLKESPSSITKPSLQQLENIYNFAHNKRGHEIISALQKRIRVSQADSATVSQSASILKPGACPIVYTQELAEGQDFQGAYDGHFFLSTDTYPLRAWHKEAHNAFFQRCSGVLDTYGAPKFQKEALEEENLTPLARHLFLLGYLPEYNTPQGYSLQACIQGIKTLQKVHDLPASGVLDASTLALLNTPLSRIAKALKEGEAFWQRFSVLPASHVIINIPECALYGFHEGRGCFYSRVCLGKPETSTPEFYMPLNKVMTHPTWYVPKKYYEKYRHLVGKRGFVMKNGQIMQGPVPKHPMGTIKFFPDVRGIRLHGTGNPDAMTKSHRAISLGCVRIDDVYRFLHFLMGHGSTFGSRREAIDKALTKNESRLFSVPLTDVWAVYHQAGGRMAKAYHPKDRHIGTPHEKTLKKFLPKNPYEKEAKKSTRWCLEGPDDVTWNTLHGFLNHPSNPHPSQVFLRICPDVYNKG